VVNGLYIIVAGCPGDGFEYYGPYQTHEEACTTAEADRRFDNGDWWVDVLLPVDDKAPKPIVITGNPLLDMANSMATPDTNLTPEQVIQAYNYIKNHKTIVEEAMELIEKEKE
jgi:hypothetical protein